MGFLDDDKPKRKPLSKTEWKVKTTVLGNKCVICGIDDKQSGGLEKAHIRAHSKGGSEVLPMCANCHKKYDGGKLTATQLQEIGLTTAAYKRAIPSKKKKSSVWDNYL